MYHIVAVNDFNMGAMENKGLNVFNTAAVLAKPRPRLWQSRWSIRTLGWSLAAGTHPPRSVSA